MSRHNLRQYKTTQEINTTTFHEQYWFIVFNLFEVARISQVYLGVQNSFQAQQT